ncbi:MAG: nonstructural protein [Microvirus sp.]|nr:MAG: nonstructural protein [Microvirus sp.]
MNKIIVAVKDRAIDAYMNPFVVQHSNAAARAFQDEVNREGSEMNKHAEDYDLYKLAEWDDATGQIFPTTPHERIARAQDLIKNKE